MIALILTHLTVLTALACIAAPIALTIHLAKELNS